MSYVITQPQMLATAAASVAGIGSTLGEANAAAAGRTTGVVTAAADEYLFPLALFIEGESVLETAGVSFGNI